MKKIFIAFFLLLIFLSNLSFAQIRNYGVDIDIDKNGEAITKITITFAEIENEFNAVFPVNIKNLKAESTAGNIDCQVISEKVSQINCKFNLTEEKKTIKLEFLTNDFVSKIEDTFYFNADLSIWKDINEAFIAIRLPEGFVLSKNITINPANAIITSDERGRRIVIVWRFNNIESNSPLTFQLAYESTFKEFVFPWQIIPIIVVITFIISFLIYRRLRKPEELILSVLDEYERKVMEIVRNAKEIRQKKIVQQTNLSKAKVSRVIKSLQERGLVEVEKRGRTNLIRLGKKKFRIFS